MKVMTYSDSRANYASMLDSVIDDREAVVIARSGKEPVVVIPLAEYEALTETNYLLSSPANARRLRESLERARSGKVEVHELIDPDAE